MFPCRTMALLLFVPLNIRKKCEVYHQKKKSSGTFWVCMHTCTIFDYIHIASFAYKLDYNGYISHNVVCNVSHKLSLRWNKDNLTAIRFLRVSRWWWDSRRKINIPIESKSHYNPTTFCSALENEKKSPMQMEIKYCVSIVSCHINWFVLHTVHHAPSSFSFFTRMLGI